MDGVVEEVEPALEDVGLVGLLAGQGEMLGVASIAERAVPPSRAAIAPASARPALAAPSTKFWISWAVIRPSWLASMMLKVPCWIR